MVTLYLDNFRGFSKTVIPLRPVNFLVGENSTGKTSVLALARLLCSDAFWLTQSFNLSDYEFGGFRDIVSAAAQDRPHFTIGFCLNGADGQAGADALHCCVLGYVESDALPLLDFVARTDGRRLAIARAVRREYRFWTGDAPSNWGARNASELFGLLTSERRRSASELQKLPGSIPLKPDLAPVFGTLTLMGRPPADVGIRLPGSDMVWFAPIRTRPKRTYDGYGRQFSPEGEHTPYLLRKRLSGANPETFREAIEAFGRESGLFHRVLINRLGDDAASPFELLVELEAGCPLRVNSVGYGVSQALPLVVDMLARRKDSWFAIQQPEVHLHPRAQAALGDLLFQIAETDRKHFLIETHSDFTIDRFRTNFRRRPRHKTAAQVLFFERTSAGNRVSPIPILPDGEYPQEQPAGFRDFFLKEQMSLLGI